MRAERRDANESSLVEFWRSVGALWIPQPRESGFDGLLLFREHVYVVEIKDGNKPPSARKLTPPEEHRKAECLHVGVPYHVIENCDQAAKLIGVPYWSQSVLEAR